MRITIRPTVPDDFRKVCEVPLPYRIRAVTMARGDEVLGLGGIGYRPDGTVVAFAIFTDQARRYPLSMHRAGLTGVRMFRESGVRFIFAEAQEGNPAADAWLRRLGFVPRPVDQAGAKKQVYVWERGAGEAIQR
jgi:hypothetical protein